MSSPPSGETDGQEEEASPGSGDGPPGSRRKWEAGVYLLQGESVRLRYTPGPVHAGLACMPHLAEKEEEEGMAH